MNLIPTVIEKSNNGERAYDLYSRLLQDRIIMLSGEIDDNLSNIVVAELLYLDSLNHDDISVYINSNGGSITSGMAIYDTMNFIKSDVSTICVGMAASMAAFLLASGKKGKVVAASYLGKAKTMCMMIGMALTLFYNLPFELIGINVGYALIIIATVLSVVSGCEYYYNTKDTFSANK